MSYNGSVYRIEQLSRLALFLVTLVLAGCLIAIGDKILKDVVERVSTPARQSFQDKTAIEEASRVIARVQRQRDELEEIRTTYQKSLEKAEQQYQSEKQSYGNWLQARSAIGSSQEDSEVRDRAKALERFRQIQASWRTKIDEIDSKRSAVDTKRARAAKQLRDLEEGAERRYLAAVERYTVEIFLARLAIVLPIVGIALFLFIRFRSSRFWSITWGYLLFALYFFFVGLVPHLPDSAGYIRLSVGVLLAVFVAYLLIRQISRYEERRHKALEAPTSERIGKIGEEKAIKAYQSHRCPSCESDFFLDKWYPKATVARAIRTIEEAADHCAHCGLPLFGKCRSCGKRNFLHFSFCSDCGNALTDQRDPG